MSRHISADLQNEFNLNDLNSFSFVLRTFEKIYVSLMAFYPNYYKREWCLIDCLLLVQSRKKIFNQVL